MSIYVLIKTAASSFTMSPRTSSVASIVIDATELVHGDIVKLEAADLRIINCTEDFKVGNSALTGENEPQSRSPICTNENLCGLETKNLRFFGDEIVMERSAILTAFTENEQTPINQELEYFEKILSPVAISLGVTFLFKVLARIFHCCSLQVSLSHDLWIG